MWDFLEVNSNSSHVKVDHLEHSHVLKDQHLEMIEEAALARHIIFLIPEAGTEGVGGHWAGGLLVGRCGLLRILN